MFLNSVKLTKLTIIFSLYSKSRTLLQWSRTAILGSFVVYQFISIPTISYYFSCKFYDRFTIDNSDFSQHSFCQLFFALPWFMWIFINICQSYLFSVNLSVVSNEVVEIWLLFASLISSYSSTWHGSCP
jgi:hypothetical protein